MEWSPLDACDPPENDATAAVNSPSGVAIVDSSRPRTDENPVAAEILTKSPVIRHGETFEITMRLDIPADFEIHSLDAPRPSIATQLVLELPAGFHGEEDWITPRSVRSLRPDGHHVFIGQSEFHHRIRVDSEIQPGQYVVGCSVRYQACNAKLCLRPVDLTLGVGVEVRDTNIPADADLSATQILTRVEQVYAGCTSYSDTGVVTTVFHRDNGITRTDEKPFKTAFVRPDRFRFEYSETSTNGRKSQYVVWRNASEVKSRWTIRRGVKNEASLSIAIAGATGVSGGSAHTVPALLMPGEIEGLKLSDLSQVTRAQSQKWRDEDCFRIDGIQLEGVISLWVDRNTFLIRRLDERKEHDGFRTEKTTTYEPVINEPVDEKLLGFETAPSK
jgi:hypothetical protein